MSFVPKNYSHHVPRKPSMTPAQRAKALEDFLANGGEITKLGNGVFGKNYGRANQKARLDSMRGL